MTINPDGRQSEGDARFTRRFGGLRPEPIFVVSALRAPVAIARGDFA